MVDNDDTFLALPETDLDDCPHWWANLCDKFLSPSNYPYSSIFQLAEKFYNAKLEVDENGIVSGLRFKTRADKMVFKSRKVVLKPDLFVPITDGSFGSPTYVWWQNIWKEWYFAPGSLTLHEYIEEKYNALLITHGIATEGLLFTTEQDKLMFILTYT
jgi:hypothetical protein